jgi:ABC-2 type transport system permease protein
MNRTLLRLSTQALFGRRRGIVLLLIAGALVVLAVLVRLLTDEAVGLDAVVGLGFTLALPLVALLAATAVLGPEIDDGSVVYLLAKPVNRHVIAVSKFAAAWGATMLLGALPVALAALVLDPSQPGRAAALAVGAAVSGTVYTALFLGLAALTRHAVVIGLLFVLVWEGVLGSIFAGVRWLSVGAWGRAVAGEISSSVDEAVDLSAGYAVVAAAVVTLLCIWFTGDRLRSFTLRGDE